MTVNTRSIPTQVIIGGATDLNVSQSFVSLSLSSGVWDEGGWWKLRGTLTLAGFVRGYGESFDCRLNPSRWAPGTIVAISLWFGEWVPIPTRLRILRYPNRPWPGNPTISIEIGSDADLLNYRAPEGDPSGITYGTPTGATFLINAALARAGAPALADTVTGLLLPFSPGKTGGESWITYAGNVAHAAGRQLWQQADGDVRAVPLDMDGLEPFATYIVGSQEADYIPEVGGDAPPEKLKVTGTTYQIDSVSNDGFVTIDTVDGVTIRTTVSYSGRSSGNPVYSETVETFASLVLPAYFTTNVLIVATELTRAKEYGIGFRLTSETETLRQPVGGIFPGEVFGTPTQLAVANRTTIAYTYDGDDNMIRRVTTLERAVISGVTVTTGTSQITTERWQKVGNEEWAYNRNQVNFDGEVDPLPPRRGPSTNNRPPQTQYRPATRQRIEKEFSGTATFTNESGSGFAEKLQVITLPSGMATSNAQCRAIAQRWGRIRQGRQFAVQWAADITAAWLQSFTPVRRIDFVVPEPGVAYDATATYPDGAVVYYQSLSYRAITTTTGNLPTNGAFWEPANIRTAYLIEAFNLNIDQRSAAIGGRGVEIGIVSRNEPLPAPSDPGDAPEAGLPIPAPPFFTTQQEIYISGYVYGGRLLEFEQIASQVFTSGYRYGGRGVDIVVTVESFAGGYLLGGAWAELVQISDESFAGGYRYGGRRADVTPTQFAGGYLLGGEQSDLDLERRRGGYRYGGQFPAPAIWTPAQLGSNLLAWYGPESTYSAGAWQDLSGLGRNTSQATVSLRPERVAGVLNGKPVTRFTNDWISCGTGWDYDDVSVFVLAAPAVAINSSNIHPIMGAGINADRRMSMFFGGFTASQRFNYMYIPQQQPLTDHGYAANEFNLFCKESTTGGSGQLRLYRNDVQAGVTQSGPITKLLASDEMRIGQRVGTAFTGSFSGDLFEYVVTRKLSEADRQKMAGYILHNAGLQANLPTGHPFKTNPPLI